MNIVVTGANGQVGQNLIKLASGFGFSCVGFGREELDIADFSAVGSTLAMAAPDVIINAAAYTAVDKAESEVEKAYLVNEVGPHNLAAFCAKGNIPLLHISTDYVFNGKSAVPYVESDDVNPASVYGQSKAAGEVAVRTRLKEHVILRTSWVFSSEGNNFVKTMLRLAGERDCISVVNDQIGGPTSAESIARVLLVIVKKIDENTDFNEWGTYHFSGLPFVTWYEFAKQVFNQAESKSLIKSTPLVEPITSEGFMTVAARPANSSLNSDKIHQQFGTAADDWINSLEKVLIQQAKS